MKSSILKKFGKNVLIGVLVIAPLYVSFVLIKWLVFIWTDFAVSLMPVSYRHHWAWVLRFGVLLFFCITLILAGYLARFVFIQQFFNILDKLIFKIPLFGIIYKTSRQITNAFFKSENVRFKRMAVIEYPRQGLYNFGFITSKGKSEIFEKIGAGDVESVFVGTAPNPITGVIVFAKKKELQEMDMTAVDGLKLIMSAGIITPQNPAAAENTI